MTANETYPGTISGITINGTATDITADITTGKLGALIQMRDEQLPAMSDQLDQLAAQLRDQVNQVNNRGAKTPLRQGTGAADPAEMNGSRPITTPNDPQAPGYDVN